MSVRLMMTGCGNRWHTNFWCEGTPFLNFIKPLFGMFAHSVGLENCTRERFDMRFCRGPYNNSVGNVELHVEQGDLPPIKDTNPTSPSYNKPLFTTPPYFTRGDTVKERIRTVDCHCSSLYPERTIRTYLYHENGVKYQLSTR